MRHTDKKRILNRKFLESIAPPEKGRIYFYDERTPGLRIQITKAGAMSWQLYRWHQGKPLTMTLGRWPAMNVAQARRAATRVLADLAEGKNPIEEKRAKRAKVTAVGTLQKALDDYLAMRELKPRTREDVPATLRWGVNDWLSRPLTKITPAAVEKRYKELCKRSVASANRTMRYLRAVYNHARARYCDFEGNPLLPENPVARLSLTRSWRRVERRRTVIRPHELRGWWEAVGELPSQTHTDYFRFVLLTGLRRSEALGLRWGQIDMEGKVLELTDTKARRPHYLPLTAHLIEMLERRKKMRRRGAASAFVFADEKGRVISNFRYSQRFVEERSGVRFCIHDLRRTFITIAESLDIPMFALKRLLNHATDNDVTGGYIVSGVERLRTPMARITHEILRLAGEIEEDKEEITSEEIEAARDLLRRAGAL